MVQANQLSFQTTRQFTKVRGHRPRWYINRWRKYYTWTDIIMPSILAIAKAEEHAFINGDCAP